MILLALEFTEHGLTHPEEHILALKLRDKLLAEYAPDIKTSSFAARGKGKPYIKDSDISYSVTHTDGCTGCAVSFPYIPVPEDVPHLPDTVTESGVYAVDDYDGECELGVDFERVATSRDEARLSAIASRYFDEAENVILRESHDKCAAFYRLWTSKESMVKCTGEGLSALSFAETPEAVRMGFVIKEFTLENGGCRFSGSICRNFQLLDL